MHHLTSSSGWTKVINHCPKNNWKKRHRSSCNKCTYSPYYHQEFVWVGREFQKLKKRHHFSSNDTLSELIYFWPTAFTVSSCIISLFLVAFVSINLLFYRLRCSLSLGLLLINLHRLDLWNLLWWRWRAHCRNYRLFCILCSRSIMHLVSNLLLCITHFDTRCFQIKFVNILYFDNLV
jgi:hypothetical protein